MTPEAQHYVFEKISSEIDKLDENSYFDSFIGLRTFIKKCKIMGLIDHDMSKALIKYLDDVDNGF